MSTTAAAGAAAEEIRLEDLLDIWDESLNELVCAYRREVALRHSHVSHPPSNCRALPARPLSTLTFLFP